MLIVRVVIILGARLYLHHLLIYCTILQLSHRRSKSSSSSSSSRRGSSSSSVDRHVTQLVFGRWPEVGLPHGQDLLAFAKTAISCRSDNPAAKAMIQSR